MNVRRWLVIFLTLLSVSSALTGQAFASGKAPGGATAWGEAYEEAFARGRDAYNSEDFQGARQAFIEAIQHAPEQGAGYRNLARTYYWLREYAAAVAYYDYYLRLNAQAEDVAEIQQERRSALSRADGALWTLPADQQLIRTSFLQELEEGRGLTAGGGGAYGLFEALLRAGFAAPEVSEYRQRLEQKISAEFEAALTTGDAFLPLMRGKDWEMQAERLEALSGLVRRPERLRYLERRALLIQGVLALLDGNYERGAHDAGQAALQNPDLPWINWYHILALSRASRPQQALQAVEELLARRDQPPAARQRYEVLRAHILRQLDRADEATELYQGILLKSN